MHPIICKIRPFTIYSYGAMLVAAFLVSTALAARQAKKQALGPDFIFNFAFIVFIWGVVGARAFYIIGNLRFYLKEPLEIFMLQHGGLSWFGGLILGSISAAVYLKKKKLNIYKVLDLIAPFVALAQAIGRIGCLLNGCCFGRESTFGIYFPVYDKVLIPTQIYSSLILISIFIFLRFLQSRPHPSGEVFFFYLLLYSTKRFFIEFWRAENPVIVLGLNLFQLISIVIFSFALIKLLFLKRSKN